MSNVWSARLRKSESLCPHPVIDVPARLLWAMICRADPCIARARLAKIKQSQAKSISKRASHMGRTYYPFLTRTSRCWSAMLKLCLLQVTNTFKASSINCCFTVDDTRFPTFQGALYLLSLSLCF
jgi:hypothetical protein